MFKVPTFSLFPVQSSYVQLFDKPSQFIRYRSCRDDAESGQSLDGAPQVFPGARVRSLAGFDEGGVLDETRLAQLELVLSGLSEGELGEDGERGVKRLVVEREADIGDGDKPGGVARRKREREEVLVDASDLEVASPRRALERAGGNERGLSCEANQALVDGFVGLPLPRGRPGRLRGDQDVERALEVLERGLAVLVHPQRTREPDRVGHALPISRQVKSPVEQLPREEILPGQVKARAQHARHELHQVGEFAGGAALRHRLDQRGGQSQRELAPRGYKFLAWEQRHGRWRGPRLQPIAQ